MALNTVPQFDVIQYGQQINALGGGLAQAQFTYSQAAFPYFDTATLFWQDWRATNILNQLINLYNLLEQSFFEQAAATDYLSQIAAGGLGGGSVDLGNLEFYLQSINQSVSNIAVAVGGGAPAGLADIVAVLDQRLFDVAAQVFNVAQNQGAGTGSIALALTAGVQGTFGTAVDSGLKDIAAKLQQLVTLVQLTAGISDPATARLADNTQTAAAFSAAVGALAQLGSQPTATDFTEYLRHSNPDDLGSGLARIGNALREVLQGNLFSTKERDAFTALVGQGDFSKARVVLQDYGTWLAAQPAEIVAEIVGKLFSAIHTLSDRLEPALAGLFQPIFKTMLGGIKTNVQAAGEVAPTSGFAVAEQFLSQAAINGMHAHHLAELFEMIPYTKHFGMNMLPAFLADMAGFGQIANQTWGRAVGEGVGRAAGYEINASMRSRIPNEALLEQMVFEGQMSEQEQAVLLAFHGYSDRYIQAMQAIQYREPNLRQLSSLAADASMEPAQVDAWLREGGFSPADAQRLTPIVMQQSMRTERGTLVTEVMSNLRNGFISEQDAEIYFDRLRLQPEARELLFTAARLGARREAIVDNVATYKAQYHAGLIDDGDLRVGLAAQGLTASRIAIEHASAATKRSATVATHEAAEVKAEIRKQQSLLVQTLRDAFQHGLIDAAQFRQTLVAGGLTEATAEATVQLEAVKLEGRALTARSAEAARIIQQEQRVREDAFTELFRKGAINNLQLEQLLSGSGIPAPVVRAIVDREVARARPTAADLAKTPAALKAKELATLAKSKLQVQFAKAQISADDYLSALVALGVDVEIATATVALEVAKRAGEKLPPAPAKTPSAELKKLQEEVRSVLEQFAASNQTAATLETILERLGIVEDVLQAIIAQGLEAQQAAATEE